MVMLGSLWMPKKVLITVRTYPVPSRQDIEVSCTAGVTDDGSWIRLFPVPYRFLSTDRRFRKYQWVEVKVRKASSDHRPESFNPDPSSLTILSEPIPSDNRWEQRRRLVEPLVKHCMCCIRFEQQNSGSPTLGVFRPSRIDGLIIEQERPNWTEDELSKLRQYSLFADSPAAELERIPYKFSYKFWCDHDDCNSHTMSCTDWELGQLYRNCIREHGAAWEIAFRQKAEHEMLTLNDTHFYVGTVHRFPDSWIIVGLFYPRKAPNMAKSRAFTLPLFDWTE